MPQNSKDQVQAYRFMQRRVRTALLEGDPESNDRPMARLGIATYSGVALGVLLLAIVGIIGVLRPGGATSWQQPGALISERETTARYVYLSDTLYPVLNYASAKLILGDRLNVVSVSGKSLSGTRHGDPIGIPNAPDSLPDASHVVAANWSMCSVQNLPASVATATALEPGTTAAGTPLNDGSSLPHGILLHSNDSSYYLAWNDTVFPISTRGLVALGYSAQNAFPVDATFVSAIRQGAALNPPALSGVGSAATFAGAAPGRRVGEVLAGPGGSTYLVLANGLARLTSLQLALLRVDPALAPVYGNAQVTPVLASSGELAQAPMISLPNTTRAGTTQSQPSSAPPLIQVPSSAASVQLCALYPGDGTPPRLVYGPAQQQPASGVDNLVRLRTGYGALVRTPPGGVIAAPPASASATPTPAVSSSAPAGESPIDTGTTYLVADTGIAYPIGTDDQSLTALGLQGAPISVLPPAVIRALGQPGPTLSVEAAKSRITAGGGLPAAVSSTPSR